MLSSNFDYKDNLFQNISFPFSSSNMDYNLEKYLENNKYEFPLSESLMEEPEIENDIFNKTLLFNTPSTLLSSNFEEESNSISLDENNKQNFEIKTENKTYDKFEEFNSSKTNIDKDLVNMENKTSLNEAPKEKNRLIFDVLANNELSQFTKKVKLIIILIQDLIYLN